MATIVMQKMNKQVKVPEHDVESMKQMGFSALDASGKMIKTKAKDAAGRIAQLEAMISEKDAEISALTNKVLHLESINKELLEKAK